MNYVPLRAARQVLGSVQTVWCMVGVCVAAILLVELALRFMFLAKDTWIDEPPQDSRVVLDQSGNNLPLAAVAEYWDEFESSKMPEWRSYVYWRRPTFQGKYVNVDAHGIRRTWSDESAESVPNGPRLRVFVFGGSTVWGSGARDDYTIPSCLAKILNENAIRADVVNFGESGYVSTQEVIALMLRLQQGDVPDAVVFYDGINDVHSALQSGLAGLPQNESNRCTEFNLSRDKSRLRQAYLEQLPNELQGFYRLVHSVQNRLPAAGATRQGKNWGEKLPRDVVKVYEENVRLVQALADAGGFSSHFIWQPVVYTKRKLTDFELRQAEPMEYAKSFYLAAYECIRQSESVNHIASFVNISTIFDDAERQLYLDFAHVTEEANYIIAKRIAEGLIPALRQKSTRYADWVSQAPGTR